MILYDDNHDYTTTEKEITTFLSTLPMLGNKRLMSDYGNIID